MHEPTDLEQLLPEDVQDASARKNSPTEERSNTSGVARTLTLFGGVSMIVGG